MSYMYYHNKERLSRTQQASNFIKTREVEKFHLLMVSSMNGQQQLGKLISYVFSNENLYINSYFRKLVEQDRKGYVFVHELLKIEQIEDYFKEIDMENDQLKLLFLKSTIIVFCPELHFNDGRVRRLNPWKRNIIKELKPIIINDIKQKLTASDLRDYFGEDSFTTVGTIQPHSQEIIRVFMRNRNQVLDRLKDESLPFYIINYSKACLKIARESRWWQSANQKRYSAIEDPYQIRRNEIRNRSFHQNTMRTRQSQQEQDYDDRQNAQALAHQFFTLVKNPNPSFNSLLRNIILSNQIKGQDGPLS